MTDLIRYDLLVQDALRSVVRKVMSDVARNGLPGEHHFYVSFRTHAPGVRISNRLRERHPDEMTIVLQHQFWDLGVTEHGFEVGLSFGGVPERLLVPFDALSGFWDPSVQFGLKFESSEAAEASAGAADEPPATESLSPPAADGGRLALAGEGVQQDGQTLEPVIAAPKPAAGRPKKQAAAASAEPEAEHKAEGSAEVLSLDAFRKKR
jgi:hypothetical protein